MTKTHMIVGQVSLNDKVPLSPKTKNIDKEQNPDDMHILSQYSQKKQNSKQPTKPHIMVEIKNQIICSSLTK